MCATQALLVAHLTAPQDSGPKSHAGTSVPAGIAASESALLHSKLRSLMRPAMGSAAFLAAVECSWQLHEQCAPPPTLTCLRSHCKGCLYHPCQACRTAEFDHETQKLYESVVSVGHWL